MSSRRADVWALDMTAPRVGRQTGCVKNRSLVQNGSSGLLTTGLRILNDRHPWSHNDAFHPWIITRLPDRRHDALDVGCGRGELIATLAEHFDSVRGVDTDAPMQRAATARCAGLANVRVEATELGNVSGGIDLITMVAVLHHLDLPAALQDVRRILRPGGRFLCVGLARPQSATDYVWDLASVATNPLIGYIRHPWVAQQSPGPPPFPVADPHLTFAEIHDAILQTLPGAAMHHHLGFRHTIEWTNPGP